MDPKELIAALGVVADPNASSEDKAAALDKLSAYFNSLLDSQSTESSSEGGSEESSTESSSEAGEGEGEGGGKSKDEPSKEMASALAKVAALEERIAKMEKASAVGRAPRAQAPTIIPRKQEDAATKDPVLQMINEAAANTRRNASK